MLAAMPEFPHLKNAPIVEALIFFQADASASWKPDVLAEELKALWPEHDEIQKMQTLKVELKVSPGEQPKQDVTSPGIDGLMFRSKSKPTVLQARRDGFIASWLKPYPNWETFQADAIERWERYSDVIGSPTLHGVLVKFINRLEFPLSEFLPNEYMTMHPTPPPSLGWQFTNFAQQTDFQVPGTPFAVQTVLARAFDATPELLAFILDIEVKVREPLSAIDRSLDEVLAEMRNLKNTAFFGMLTERAWRGYL